MKPARQFDSLLKEILDTQVKKGHDYAAPNNPFSNFEFAAKLVQDFTMPIDRVFASIIGIKLARLIELQHKDAVNESVIDTYKDLSVYCLLWYWYHESKMKLESQEIPEFTTEQHTEISKHIKAHVEEFSDIPF